ncbi:MAG: ribosomal L7Ae/L30e/S12e/Gadd45 family protein [Gemmatimonadales bacterium]|jgi:ribosomal protein L7Ae-like RNA K-turn-binding protein|nr:MAG: ribosomal L7Ae/L30e/S12e/Gadd45 family protein [Gemmatimonadales bacterium]
MSPRNPRTDLLGFLGLAHRAGSVVRGTEAVRLALRQGKVFLVLVAGDASDTQKKKIMRLLEHRGVPHAVLGTRSELGGAVGGPPLSALAVTEPAFAKSFLERLEASPGARERPAPTEESRTHAG